MDIPVILVILGAHYPASLSLHCARLYALSCGVPDAATLSGCAHTTAAPLAAAFSASCEPSIRIELPAYSVGSSGVDFS